MAGSDDLQNDRSGPLKSLAGSTRDLRKYTHQIWLAGLGAFAKAEEEGSKLFDSLVEAGEAVEAKTKDKAESRVEEVKNRVRDRTGETMEKMEKAFDERLAGALSRLGIPSNDDVEGMQDRIEDLAKNLKKLAIPKKKGSVE